MCLQQRQFDYYPQDYGSLRRYYDKHGYPYHLRSSPVNTDPFVAKCLKMYDRELYEKCRGYTKRVDVEIGMSNVLKYGKIRPKHRPDDQYYQRSIELTRQKFDTIKVPTLGYDEVMVNFPNLGSAAGFTFPGKKKKEVVQEAFNVAQYMKHMIKIKRHVYQPPFKVAFRGHLSPQDDVKVRPVWVAPFEILILESVFCNNVYSALQERGNILHFGKQSMPRLHTLLNTQLKSGLTQEYIAYSLDWSSFDTTLPGWLIEDAFWIVEQMIDFGKTLKCDKIHVEEKQSKIDSRKSLYSWLKWNFIHSKIMFPNGDVYKKDGGIPSGSQFTQLIGSVCNMIMVKYLLLKQKIYQVTDMERYLGDDCLFFVKGHYNQPDLKQMQWHAKDAFGTVLNDKKCKVTKENGKIKFLGYESSGTSFFKPEIDVWRGLLYCETPVENLNVSATRVLAYLILGGHQFRSYCVFVKYFDAVYELSEVQYQPTPGIQRMLKHLLGDVTFTRRKSFKFSQICWMNIPYVLSKGFEPFKDNCSPVVG